MLRLLKLLRLRAREWSLSGQVENGRAITREHRARLWRTAERLRRVRMELAVMEPAHRVTKEIARRALTR